MAVAIIVFVGLDQVPPADLPGNILNIVKALKGFGTTPIRFILTGKCRKDAEVLGEVRKALKNHQSSTQATNCTAPSSIDVEPIDIQSGQALADTIPISQRADVITQWLADRVAEMAQGMGVEKSSLDSVSSSQSLEANHGSDSDGANAAARNALESNPSPFAGSLGCVVIVDEELLDIPIVGAGHCLAIGQGGISPKDAFNVAQIVRRTPSATRRVGLATDIVLTGIVKRYNPTKGFGFITVNDQDVFVHQSHIVADGFRGLNIGESVSLRIDIVKGKPEARQVVQHTPYVATFESDLVVEGTHRNAGAPASIRKERKKTANECKAHATQINAERVEKSKKEELRVPKGQSSPVARPDGQLIFSENSIPYSFRAHDGTIYCFPMPVLVRASETSAASATAAPMPPIPARAVIGGFSRKATRQRSVRHFQMITPEQQFCQMQSAQGRNQYSAPRVPYDTQAPRGLNPASPAFEMPRPPQLHVQPQSQPTANVHARVRQHSPYESPLNVSRNASPTIAAAQQSLPPPLQEGDELKTDGPSYAQALLSKTKHTNTDTLTAGVIEVPRRQR